MSKIFFTKNDLNPLLKLAIPLAITGVIQSSSYFFETLFLARLGEEILAAGALVSWLFATFTVILFGTFSAVNVLVSYHYGAKNYKKISFVVRDGLLLATISAIPITLLCWNMAPIFLYFGQPASVVSFAQAYLHALSWSILPNFIMIVLLDLIVGLGHTRKVMIFSFISVALTIFFSYVLIFGKLGFPMLGISGAGWAITISNVISTIFIMIYSVADKNLRIFLQSIFIFEKPTYAWELMRIGVPMGLMYSVEVGFFFALTLIAGTFGSEVLAANQIAMQYLGFLMAMIFSIAQAITVRMGHLLGEKKYDSVANVAYLGAAISGGLMFCIGIIFWLFPRFLISLDFNINDPKNAELLHFTEQILIISSIFQIVEAIRIAFFGALRALKETHYTLLVSIFSFWGIALPVGYYFATKWQLAGQGLWLGMVLGATISIGLLVWRFRFKMRSYNRVYFND